MKYNQLSITASKKIKRVGRGISAGQGKTAGRGTKGQGSRTGGGVRPGFEGGQNPLMQRLPKNRGFKSLNDTKETIYTSQLEKLGASKVDNEVLYKAGLVKNAYSNVKLVVKGEITKKFTISLQGISETALTMVQKAGGSFTKIDRPLRAPKSAK